MGKFIFYTVRAKINNLIKKRKMDSSVGTNKNSSIEMLRLFATLGVVFDHMGVCWIHYYDQPLQ